jgi:hypothetical protein
VSTNVSIHDVCPGSRLGAVVVVVEDAVRVDGVALDPPLLQPLTANTPVANHAIA